MSDFFAVVGVANPRAVADMTSHYMNARDLAAISRGRNFSIPLLVEHEPHAVAGRVARFWVDGTGAQQLWALALIDMRTEIGQAAKKQVLSGQLLGFSLGNSIDGWHLDKTNEVKKLDLVELSLVHDPDAKEALLYHVAEVESVERTQKRPRLMAEAARLMPIALGPMSAEATAKVNAGLVKGDDAELEGFVDVLRALEFTKRKR